MPSQGAEPTGGFLPTGLDLSWAKEHRRKTRLDGALTDSTPNVSHDLGMTLPCFPHRGPEGFRLSDVQECSGPPSSLRSHLASPSPLVTPNGVGPTEGGGEGRSEPGVCEENGRAERGCSLGRA